MNEESVFHVRAIEHHETQVLRHRILWPHKAASHECTIDIDQAAHAHHVGAFNPQGHHVGVCSLFAQRSERYPSVLPLDESVYRLRVMGTLPEVRGQGAGAAIIEYACDWCRKEGASWLWCDAREVAFDFYEKVGFSFVSEPYEVAQIGPHRMMARKL